ncbi:hypothetical protein ACFWM5_18950 [Streptomyces bobili]
MPGRGRAWWGRRAFLLAGFIPKRGAAVMAAAVPEEAQEAMPVKA